MGEIQQLFLAMYPSVSLLLSQESFSLKSKPKSLLFEMTSSFILSGLEKMFFTPL